MAVLCKNRGGEIKTWLSRMKKRADATHSLAHNGNVLCRHTRFWQRKITTKKEFFTMGKITRQISTGTGHKILVNIGDFVGSIEVFYDGQQVGSAMNGQPHLGKARCEFQAEERGEAVRYECEAFFSMKIKILSLNLFSNYNAYLTIRRNGDIIYSDQ